MAWKTPADHFRYDEIKKMIEKQKTKHGWEFIFLGANIDAAAEAERFGISECRSASYHADAAGVAMNFDVVCSSIDEFRVNKKMSADWKAKIDEDFESRKKK
jgi:hypothetical protein